MDLNPSTWEAEEGRALSSRLAYKARSRTTKAIQRNSVVQIKQENMCLALARCSSIHLSGHIIDGAIP